MKLTNNAGLPQTFVTVLERDDHKSADYSASQLTKPVRMVHLEKRHLDEVTEDVTDHIWRLFGSAVHAMLQTGETSEQLIEEYFKEELDGISISGMSDIYDNKKISDYKVTSVWTWVFLEDKLEDFTSQLNTYGWLFRKAGFPVESLEIVMILRDWMKSKIHDRGYPPCQVQRVRIQIWDMDVAEAYISARLETYEKFKKTADDQLPECTPKERWAKDPTYAIMKKGAKRAYKVCKTIEEAQAALPAGPYEIEKRLGDQWKRCEYCSVRGFCNQYNNAHPQTGEA